MKYLFSLMAFLLTCVLFPVVGECGREFIFIINSGQSMNASDPMHAVQDSVTWSLENFSAEDEVAVIAFKDRPIVLRPLSKVGGTSPPLKLNYSGSSDAGKAMLLAMNMFKRDYGVERNIIVISNGEIALKDSAATLKSWEDFNACLQQAKWLGISVYVVKLNYFGAPQNYHSFAHDAKEMPGDWLDMMTTLRALMFDTFGAPHMQLPLNSVAQGKFFCEVPIRSARRLKFFLLSSNRGEAEINGTPDEVINRPFAKIFTFDEPTADVFEFDTNYPQGTGLTLDAVVEVEGSLQTEVRTSTFAPSVLEITPVHNDEAAEKIFANKFFDGKPLRVKVDDKIIKTAIHNGTISVELEDVGDKVHLQKVFFEDLGLKFIGEDSAQLDVSNRLIYLTWFLALVGVAVIGALSYLLIRKNRRQLIHSPKGIAVKRITPSPSKIIHPPRDKNFLYKGELIVSVMKCPSADYIEPRTFNLFRHNAEPIDLPTILKACGIDFDAKAFSGITFSPSANGVFVENDSDCTLVKMNRQIVRGTYAELEHADSVDAATADRSAELFVTYRSLKPI